MTKPGRLDLSTTTPPEVNPPSLTEDDWMESINDWCFENLPQGCFQGQYYYEEAQLQEWHRPILEKISSDHWSRLMYVYAWETGLRLHFKFDHRSESELEISIENIQIINICSPYTQGKRRSGYALKNSLARV